MSAPPFPPQPAGWRESLVELWWGRKILDDAVQVEKDRRRQLIVERLIKKTQDGTLGTKTDDPFPNDEMAVSVGHQYHWHNESRGGGGMGKILAGLAVAAGLVGGPLATYLLMRTAGEIVSPPAVVQPGEDRDSDTALSLTFGD